MQKLPQGFQRSEFLLEKGFLMTLCPGRNRENTCAHAEAAWLRRIDMDAMNRVRARARATAQWRSHIKNILTNSPSFTVTGVPGTTRRLSGNCIFIRYARHGYRHRKGADTNERISRNFGSPHPEGYRKALRLFKQAENSVGP